MLVFLPHTTAAAGLEQDPIETGVDLGESFCMGAATNSTPSSFVFAGSDVPHSTASSEPSSHCMVTRSQLGVFKLNLKYVLVVQVSTIIPSESKFVKLVLAHPGLKAAMVEKLNALHKNNTWRLVALPV